MEGWGVKDWNATSWGASDWGAKSWRGMNQSRSDWGSLKSVDWGAKQASWWNNMPTRYTYGQRMSAGGTPYEPQYGGQDYRPWSGYTQDLVDSDIQSWIEREHPELFEFNSGTINAGSGGGGNVGRMPNFSAGNFAKDPTVYDEIESAANQYGVPANFLQAIIAAESSGDWQFENSRNGGLFYLGSRNKYLYPYVGVFEDTAKSRVPGVNFQALKGNRAGQIGLLAQVLRSQYDQITAKNPAYTWANVASFHYSGFPDPSAPGGMWYDESGNGSNASYMAKIMGWVNTLDQYTTANGGAVGAGGTANGGGGMSSPNTPQWAPTNQWDRLVAAAAAKYGVPANLVKSILRFESQGIPTAVSPQGATGLMQIMPGIHNGGNAQQLLDPAYNIDMGTRILRDNYKASGSWQGAAQRYIGLGGTDARGNDSNSYWAAVNNYWSELDRGINVNGQAGGGAVTNVSAIWGGQDFPVTQEHGPTDFARANPGMYDYSYNLLGDLGHPGIDVGMPIGTKLFSPVTGTVIQADPSGGYQSTSSGGNQTGQLRIRLDNGHLVILGHMDNISVTPGSRVTAGQYVGGSGIYGTGAHLHLEYRIADASRPGGWAAVDPREALRGAFGGSFSGNMTGAGIDRPMTFQDMLRAGATGGTIYGGSNYGTGSGWHDWLRQAMRGEIAPGQGEYKPIDYGAATDASASGWTNQKVY